MKIQNNRYIYGLDLSLSNSGVAIFKGLQPIVIESISTNSKNTHALRLNTIASRLLKLSQKYEPEIVVFESGFYRYPKSTQSLYRVQGAVMYIFYKYEQVFYPPSTIKKRICGKGNGSKLLVQENILTRYPDLKFDNMDQSDAVAVALTYIDEKGIK